MTGSVTLVDDILVFDFPYSQDLVTEIKGIRGAKWDKIAKVWRVPVGSLVEARQFAVRHDFHIDNDILLLSAPPSSAPAHRAYIQNDYIFLSFPYDPVKVRSVKAISGITWDRKTMAWKAPLTSIDEALSWAKRFNVPIDEDVTAHAENVKKSLSVLHAASKSVDADIEVPGLAGELLPYQKAGIKYAASARRAFIADEMGLGKTLQAMATVEYLASQGEDVFPCIVVCPPSLVLNWRKEWNKFFPARRVDVVTNRKSFPIGYEVLVVGYSNIYSLQTQLVSHKSYIFDESHYCKTPTSQRTKAAKKIVKSAPPAAPVILLTGTPVTNRPAEYAPQLEMLGQIDKFGGLWGFYRRYCAAYRDRWGQWNFDGNSHLDELNDKLRSTCYIRRVKTQVMKELPPVVHNEVLVDGAAEPMKVYRKAEADIVAYLVERAKEIAAELGLSVKSAAVQARFKAENQEHLVRISVLRKLAARAKMAVAHELIQSHIDEGRKVVVAAHHREIVDEVASKYGGLKIQGSMTVEAVEEAKAKFQELPVEEAPVIVLSIQAAKTGHTLTAAQNIMFLELPWTPADLDQTIARCHRIGQVGSVTSTYLLTEGTIDEEIYETIRRKRSVVNKATEGFSEDNVEDVDLVTRLFDIFGKA
jgi:SWI/SNF-related matrix-associated actin-dependent regulator 1 of chromatin subfamily A